MKPTLIALDKFDKAHRKGPATLSDVGLSLLRPDQIRSLTEEVVIARAVDNMSASGGIL